MGKRIKIKCYYCSLQIDLKLIQVLILQLPMLLPQSYATVPPVMAR